MAKQQQQQQPKQEEQQKNDATQKKTEQPAAAKPKKSKIGEGTLKAWIRQGGKEIDQVWAAFPANSSMQIVQESGNIWNPPSMDVSNQTGATKRAAEVRDNMNAKKKEAPKQAPKEEAKEAKQQDQKPRDIEPEMDPG